MKATIVFDKMPGLHVEGQLVGNIQQIDLDLNEDGTITIGQIHVHDRWRTHIPTGFPPGFMGLKPMLAPWEEGRPEVPVHPRLKKISSGAGT